MKTKTLDKKFHLRKRTVVDLKKDDLKKVRGGIWESMQISKCCGTNSGVLCC